MEHASLVLTHDPDEGLSKPLTRYDVDAHAWAMEQAELMRLRRFDELDIENLADEVQDVARRERRELLSRLSLVYQHLLKWDHQPDRRSASWARTIVEQRRQVDELLDEARSLRSHLPALTETAFRQGRVAALNETDLPDAVMPDIDPYSWDDVMTRPIVWPEP
ncbi:MAG: DUF29 domain-containing protein [Janthinobacterium lividum]